MGRVFGFRRIGMPLALGLSVLAIIALLPILGLAGCDTALRDRIELYVNGCKQIQSDGVVYVDGINGTDSNPGTQELPKKTIQNAIDLADALMDLGEVRVAQGTYHLYKTLIVREGISLYGGFQASGWTRDIETYTTVLQGVSVDTVIKPEQGVTTATVIDGFTIEAVSVAEATCIWCKDSSPTIQRNTLDASQGSTDTIGIFNSSSSPVILANTINAGDGTAAAWGIANSGSPAKIWSNVIFGTGSNGKYRGILNSNSDAVIQNNTIRCGLHVDDVGIYNSDSNCIMENNILFSSASSCGIEEDGSAALPVKVNNNDFYGCSPYYEYDSGSCTTVTQMEDYLGLHSVEAASNRDDNPQFISGVDWHLGSGSPLRDAITDPPTGFYRDRDWLLRSDPWSMGAYEKD